MIHDHIKSTSALPSGESVKSILAISDDSILTGLEVAAALADSDLKIKVVPFSDESGKVWFEISGDHERALQAIYENRLIGALDTLKAIKSLRQAIFTLKRGDGNGRRQYERASRSR
jgi:hypothetical protein